MTIFANSDTIFYPVTSIFLKSVKIVDATKEILEAMLGEDVVRMNVYVMLVRQ